MAKKTREVAPFEVPGTQGGLIVSPYADFDLNDAVPERPLFDAFTTEHVDIHGTLIGLWKLNVSKSAIDPLYSEPTQRVYDGPYILKAWIEYPPSDPVATEDGYSLEYQHSAWIPRAPLEALGVKSSPNMGDIIQFWDKPYYADNSTLKPDTPQGSGYFFELIDVDEDGYMFDSTEFAGWTLQIRRNTRFTPERKLTQETIAP